MYIYRGGNQIKQNSNIYSWLQKVLDSVIVGGNMSQEKRINIASTIYHGTFTKSTILGKVLTTDH